MEQVVVWAYKEAWYLFVGKFSKDGLLDRGSCESLLKSMGLLRVPPSLRNEMLAAASLEQPHPHASGVGFRVGESELVTVVAEAMAEQ